MEDTIHYLIEDMISNISRYTESCIKLYIKGIITLDELKNMVNTNMCDKVKLIKIYFMKEV